MYKGIKAGIVLFFILIILLFNFNLSNIADFLIFQANAGWFDMNNLHVSNNVSNPNGNSDIDNWVSYGFLLNSTNVPYILWAGDDPSTIEHSLYFSKWQTGVGWAKMDGTAGADVLVTVDSYTLMWNAKFLIYNDNPYVVWGINNPVGSDEIYMIKWNGSDWTNMAGDVSGPELIDTIVLIEDNSGFEAQLDSAGNPYLLYGSSDITGSINFIKWSPGAGTDLCGGTDTDCWTNMAETDNDSEVIYPYLGYQYDMAVNSRNYPYIVWRASKNVGFSIPASTVFTRWNGTSWVKMDDTAGYEQLSYEDGVRSPQLELNKNGIPYVSWFGYASGGSNYQMIFRKWTPGSGWTKMDGTGSYDVITNYTDGIITIDNVKLSKLILDNVKENPYLFWVDLNNGYDNIYFSKYTPGSGWTQMNGTSGYENISNNSDADTIIYTYDFQLGGDNMPHVAWETDINWQDVYIYYTKYNGLADDWVKSDGTAGIETILTALSPNGGGQPRLALRNYFFPEIIYYGYSDDVGKSDIYFVSETNSAGNDVTITATLDPSISLLLNANTCALNILTTDTIQTCGFNATVTTNIGTGYSGYIEQNHPFQTTVNAVTTVITGPDTDNVINGSDPLSGAYGEYGIGLKTDDTTSFSEFTGNCVDYDDGTTDLAANSLVSDETRYSFATYDAAVNGVNHGLTYFCAGVRIKYTTPPGQYDQTLTISVVGNF